MKKKLEAELISIAHRILKLKNKSDIIQLHQEAQKVYERLSVLRFVEEHLSDAKPTIGQKYTMEQVESAFEDHDSVELAQEIEPADKPSEKPLEEKPKKEDPKSPPPAEEIKEPEPPAEERLMESKEIIGEAEELVQQKEVDQVIADAEEATEDSAPMQEPEESDLPETSELPAESEPTFTPAFEWGFESKEDESPKPKEEEKPASQFAFDDLLGKGYVDPIFVKPEDLANEKAPEAAKSGLIEVIPITRKEDGIPVYKMNNAEIADKAVSLNDRLSRGITVGLNDRIAFVKHLFGNSNEDYNRVLSQLITLTSFEDAQEFIDNMVKPDYNNWDGKEEYAQRFMEVVEKKFA